MYTSFYNIKLINFIILKYLNNNLIISILKIEYLYFLCYHYCI